MAQKAFLLLGSNLGNRSRQLSSARNFLGEQAGKIAASSRIYQTQPWGITQQPLFLNQAVLLNTTLEPLLLLEKILAIEEQMGRHRAEKWGERIIDIDILFYEDRVIHHEKLTIPHPQFQFRNFAMAPMVELAPAWKHPVLGKTVSQLLQESSDPLRAEVWRSSQKKGS